MDLLFKNVTAVTMEKDKPIIKNTNIGVKDGCVTFDPINTGRVIDCSGKVLIPGLYNCHVHSPMSLLRGYASDMKLEEWLFDYIVPAEQKIKGINNAVYVGAMLSIAEMIASGTVAFNDMYFGLADIARAIDEAGVKANLSNGLLSFEPDNFDYKLSGEYKDTRDILETYHKKSHNRIKAEASLHCAYTTHPEAWKQVSEFAKENNLTMHVHLSETITEHNKCLQMFKITPAEAFRSGGVFDIPALAAHACWISEDDMDILADYNVTVAHNPVSNLKLASGIAPIAELQKRGVNIVLGTDGMASNNSHDLFEEIKLASILQKFNMEDPTAAPALSVLKMATVNGAKAQGRMGGQIKEGYDADLVLLDFDNPRQIPCHDFVTNLVYSTSGRDVVMTMCQGRILYENGEYNTIDIEKIKYEAKKIAEAVV